MLDSIKLFKDGLKTIIGIKKYFKIGYDCLSRLNFLNIWYFEC